MTLLQSIVLGIVQGLTEFLPVSSSGHLVLFPYLLGWDLPAEDAFIFDVLVQMGTLLAVIVYFWKDLKTIVSEFVLGIYRQTPFTTPMSRMGWYLVLATIPAGLVGLMLKDSIEAAFASPVAAAFFLWGTAALLLLAEFTGKRSRSLEHMGWKDALVMGLFQVMALFPGVSRSGSTMSGAMLRNLNRPTAARFSFLMSIPIMLAAGGLAVVDLVQVPGVMSHLPAVFMGFITSAIVGYLAIRWLLHYLSHRSLVAFSVYCFAAGLFTLVVWVWRG